MCQYPNIKDAKALVIDCETKDIDLIEKGPGVYRNNGDKVVGISLAFDNGFSEYYNIGHPDCDDETREKNISYIKQIMEDNKEAKKIGTNFIYDLDWIENWLGITIPGVVYDIQIAEAIIDENQNHYSLEYMSNKYLGKGKDTAKLDRYCEVNGWTGDPRKHIWKMPYATVRDYAISDVLNPLEIIQKQWDILYKENLVTVFLMECKLLKVLLKMRKTGVLIDTAIRDNNVKKGLEYKQQYEDALFSRYGKFNYNSGKQLATILEKEGIDVPLTAKQNPSVKNDFLLSLKEEHPVCEQLYIVRKADKVLNTFLQGSLVDFVTEGDLIHCSFYGTKVNKYGSEEATYGTRSGRFSSANPNLQQIPALSDDNFWGKFTREPFVPFADHLWISLDYSQIEYRFLAHYATGQGSDEVRQAYISNPDTDYHKLIQDLTGLPRRPAKVINFGVAYGMGANKMAQTFGWELPYVYDILNTYHSKAPYVKSTMRAVENAAVRFGYIKTIMGRRSRLVDKSKAYTMFCRLIQGSAADLLKTAMVQIYDKGLLDTIKLHLTVHDELDSSAPKTQEGLEATIEMKETMENALKIAVPIKAELKLGENWGNMDKIKSYEHLKEVWKKYA